MSDLEMVIVASHGWNPDWERLHDEDDVQEEYRNFTIGDDIRMYIRGEWYRLIKWEI